MEKDKNNIKNVKKLQAAREKLKNVFSLIRSFFIRNTKKKDDSKLSVKTEEKIKKSQNMIAILIAIVVVGIVVTSVKEQFLDLESPKPGKATQEASAKSSKTKIETAGDNIKPEEMWRYKVSEDGQKIQKDVDGIKNTMTELIQKSESNNIPQFSELNTRLEIIENKLRNQQNEVSQEKNESVGIEVINLNLSMRKDKPIDTVDTVIPAGAFAKAILLSGIDAGTALSASSDPLPILVRITDPGTLPRKFKSDLKDCHVMAEGFGDISSERVIARLVSLTCTERVTGEIVETEISGFIAGEDGKAGMRGKVVSKDAKYLANGAIGGVIGGFSNMISPQDNAAPFIMSDKVQQPSMSQKFGKGFGSGMSSSMDRLSQYYIDRAESLQPVIEISAGRIVDIIFNKKAEIGSSYVKSEIAKKRDIKRRAQAQDAVSKDKYGTNNRYFEND